MVLSAGLIGGELISRIKLPRVTGWIITGAQSANLLAIYELPSVE